MRNILLSAAALTLGLSACGSPDTTDAVPNDMTTESAAVEPMQAVAVLRTVDGQEVGTATATQEGESVSISVQGVNMPAGMHGVHVHMVGSCEPDFSAAGDHWNPASRMHGLEDPAGQHAGDMPNLDVGEDGQGTVTYALEGGATFDGLMDGDGSAFIVHAKEDDQKTDPSGNSGDRIACGVFERDAGAAGTTATM